MASDARKTRQTIPIICKIVELCLTIIIVGLIVDPTNNGILAFDQNHSGIIYVSWPGYIIINTVLLIGYVIGDKIPKRTSMLFSLLGGILSIVSASVIISDWRRNQVAVTAYKPSKQYQDMAISAAVFGLLTSLVQFGDVFLIALYGEDEEEVD